MRCGRRRPAPAAGPILVLLGVLLAGALAAAPATVRADAPDRPAIGAGRPDVDVSGLMRRRAWSCPEVALICYSQMPRLYAAGKFDSMLVFTELWTARCSQDPLLLCTRILVHIAAGSYTDDVGGPNVLPMLASFVYRRGDVGRDTGDGNARKSVVYQRFLQRMAHDLAPRQPEDSLERLLCRAIAGEEPDFCLRLRDPAYARRRLHDELLADDAWFENWYATYFALRLGVWQPTGALDRYGAHPSLGLFFEGRHPRWAMRAALDFRLLAAPRDVAVVDDGQRYDTGNHLGFDTGVEYARTVLDRPGVRIDLLAGVGYDAIQVDVGETDHAPTSSSLALTGGIGIYQPFGEYDENYWGLEVRFERLRHGFDPGSDDLSGNAVTVRVVLSACTVDRDLYWMRVLQHDRWHRGP